MNILISACLLGVNCKYNGNNNEIESLITKINSVSFIPVCPEQLGGLTTPRPPAELNEEGNVFNNEGRNVTKEFKFGAEETLHIAKLYNCKYAILKERSPSCGSNQVYDGSFRSKVKPGEGMTVSLLRQNGIKVYSEENYEELSQIVK